MRRKWKDGGCGRRCPSSHLEHMLRWMSKELKWNPHCLHNHQGSLSWESFWSLFRFFCYPDQFYNWYSSRQCETREEDLCADREDWRWNEEGKIAYLCKGWPHGNILLLHPYTFILLRVANFNISLYWEELSLPDPGVSGLLASCTWLLSLHWCFQFKSEFGNKEFMIWAIVSSRSCFCWLYRASPSLTAKNIINLISVLTIWWCPRVESSLVLLEEGVCCDRCVLLAKLY